MFAEVSRAPFLFLDAKIAHWRILFANFLVSLFIPWLKVSVFFMLVQWFKVGKCVFYVSPVVQGWQIRRLVRRLAHGWQIRRLVRRLAHGWQIRRCLQIFSAFQLDAGANANLFLSLFAKLRRDSR